ncbi:MAG: ParA family protein [Verrucomicrobiales bacterium]|jgi:chromosome partitioning protein|nr:ParA family protein [Verrucomicrobiales bacterium]MDA9921735.1 ParA family protein [Verrucomicrobiales bacterium]MDB3941331.1 ParA family protein [Verrucomicrobiales bacterium]
MKIIAIANQKGGVGKTTTSVNLGACLAEKGQKVIVLDLDPQANSTSALDFTPGEHPSIYQSLIGGGEVADLVVPTKYDNLSIIPCDMDLAGCEIEMAKEDDHLVRLRNLFEPFKATEIADYILIDCPPSLGVLMTSALAAADELIVPLQCEYFGLEGLSKIVGVHQQIRDSGANSEVVLEGIVMTMADSRTNLSAMVINDVREYFPEVTYDTVIPRNIRLGEAPSYGQTVIDYAPTCAGAVAYRALADEFIARHS